MRLAIGVDPGKNGAFAVLDENGVIVKIMKMPPTEIEIFTHLNVVTASPRVARCALEGVGASPQMGVVSAFTFGAGYGALKMALTAAGIGFDIVYPRTWQKAMGCLSGGEKNVTKDRAQALFPQVKVTHAIADALLLAEYCRKFLLK